MGNENLQEYAGAQDFVQTAPVNLVFVADFDKMASFNEEMQTFYTILGVNLPTKQCGIMPIDI